MLFKLEPFIFNSISFILHPSAFILALLRCLDGFDVLSGVRLFCGEAAQLVELHHGFDGRDGIKVKV